MSVTDNYEREKVLSNLSAPFCKDSSSKNVQNIEVGLSGNSLAMWHVTDKQGVKFATQYLTCV